MTKSTVGNLDKDQLRVKQGTRESEPVQAPAGIPNPTRRRRRVEKFFNLMHLRDIPLTPYRLDVAAIK
jgi:hypothetical protein